MGLGVGPDSRQWPLIGVLDTQPAPLIRALGPSRPRQLIFARSNGLIVGLRLRTTALLILLGKVFRLEGLEDCGGD